MLGIRRWHNDPVVHPKSISDSQNWIAQTPVVKLKDMDVNRSVARAFQAHPEWTGAGTGLPREPG